MSSVIQVSTGVCTSATHALNSRSYLEKILNYYIQNWTPIPASPAGLPSQWMTIILLRLKALLSALILLYSPHLVSAVPLPSRHISAWPLLRPTLLCLAQQQFSPVSQPSPIFLSTAGVHVRLSHSFAQKLHFWIEAQMWAWSTHSLPPWTPMTLCLFLST